ncbi:MAG: hypothetical protein IJ690_04040 [Clostridia bacterium]|nr:hypothetical protein [Clostridia bacterium]
MQAIVRLYSVIPNEIKRFLSHFYEKDNFDAGNLTDKQWQKDYPNPVEIVDIIGAYIENIDDFNLTMWISIDSGVFIKVTPENADELIRYLYERFPY